MERKKRSRGANYTSKEINVLLNIIIQFKHIIENKRTDAVACREKENAWKKIANIFNSCSPSGVYRSAESLKKAFDNKKKVVRKNVAANSRSGGALEKAATDSNHELTLSILNVRTDYESKSSSDYDASVSNQSAVEETEIGSAKIIEETELSGDTNNIVIKTEDIGDCIVQVENTEENASISDFNVCNTKTLVNNKLNRNMRKCNNTYSIERRKVVPAGLRSGKRSEEYSELIKVKVECAKLQLAMLQEEKESKKIESELRQKSLQLDIHLKEMQVEKLKNDVE